MTALVLVVLACLFANGLLVLVSSWSEPEARPARTIAIDWERGVVDAGVGLGGGLALLAVTGWIVALPVGGVLGWKLSEAWRARKLDRRSEQERIEALATWCEQLRDLLSAEHGILGTVVATVATCPVAIRPEVGRLSTRVERQDPAAAIRQFAVEVDDPSGDLIASVLVLALSHSGKTSDLLGELAATIRERAAMRLRVEAERAGQRAEGRFVIGFSVIVMLGITLFGRDSRFLDAYDATLGQLVLVVIAAMFGGGIFWLSRLTRFVRPAHFLSIGGRR